MKNSFNSISCFINGNCLLRNWQNSIALPSERKGVKQGVSKAFRALVADMILGMLMVYTNKSSTATHSYVISNDYLIFIHQPLTCHPQ